MTKISTIGLDLAKNVFQVHGVDASGAVVLGRQLRRAAVEKFFAQLPPCLVGMEACGGAHQWARVISRYGHEVRLMPPAYVKPYLKRGKNDARDAEAICEAVSRPTMRFVPIKSVEQQCDLAIHKVRDLLIRQRTQLGNAVRGLLYEVGVTAAKGDGGLEMLLRKVEAASADIAEKMAEMIMPMVEQFRAIDEQLSLLDKKIIRAVKTNSNMRLLMTAPGVGPIGA